MRRFVKIVAVSMMAVAPAAAAESLDDVRPLGGPWLASPATRLGPAHRAKIKFASRRTFVPLSARLSSGGVTPAALAADPVVTDPIALKTEGGISATLHY